MRRLAGALVACALAVAGCGLGRAGAPATPPASAATATTTPATVATTPATVATATATAPASTAAPSRTIRIAGTGTLTLDQVAPPASSAPAAGIRDVAFTDATHGVLVSGGLLVGTTSGTTLQGTGRIQLTADGGRTWTTVWRSTRAALDWVGFAGAGHGFAAGASFPAASVAGAPLLLTTADGGRTWVVIHPSLPAAAAAAWSGLRFDFVSASVGYAVTDPDFSMGPADLAGVLRTTDGGRTWTQSPLPGGTATGGLAFVSATTGFATGSSRACLGAIWETTDGGAAWRLLPATCSKTYRLESLDFPDAGHGFAAGGRTDKFGTTDWQAVLATADGGRTWTTVHLNQAARDSNGGPVTRLHFTDALHGWAVTGGCVMGQNTPCAGQVLVTADGGRTWRATGQRATHLAVSGPGDAWAVPPAAAGSGLLWATADAGATWTPVGQPKAADYSLVRAAGTAVLAAGAAGLIISEDGGRNWRRIPLTMPGGPPMAAAVEANTLAVADPNGQSIDLTGNGGATWSRVTVPGARQAGLASFALGADGHGLAATYGYACLKGGQIQPGGLLATADGGRAWTPLPAPPFPFNQVAVANGVAAALGGDGCAQALALSRDGGRAWLVQALPKGMFCTAAAVAAPATVWLGCGANLLVSRNSGATWTELTSPGPQVDSLAPGWMAAGGALWRMQGAGRTWIEVWPAIE